MALFPIIRDAETEAFLRGVAHPLFRAAGVDPALVRITLVQARPINAFVTTGNRMFINTGLIQQSDSVAELAGVLAHETGHIAGGHLTRAMTAQANAGRSTILGALLGAAAAVAGAPQLGTALLAGGATVVRILSAAVNFTEEVVVAATKGDVEVGGQEERIEPDGEVKGQGIVCSA